MKIQKLLVLGTLALGLASVSSAPVWARNVAGRAHQGNGMMKQLGLTKDQKAQLKPIRQATKAQIQAIKADTTLSKKERYAKIKAIRAERNSQMNQVLTPAQQQQLAQLRAQKKAEKRAAKGT